VVSVSATDTAFFRFNIDDLPSNVIIAHAYLRVWVENTSTVPTAPATVQISSVATNWSEATLTFNNIPTINNSVGSFNIAPSDKNKFITTDITSIVKIWQSNPQINHGLALHTSIGEKYNFDGKENTVTSHQMEIEIEYDGIPGPAGPAGPHGPAGPQGPTGNSNVTQVIKTGILANGFSEVAQVTAPCPPNWHILGGRCDCLYGLVGPDSYFQPDIAKNTQTAITLNGFAYLAAVPGSICRSPQLPHAGNKRCNPQ
jgi:hypothetical protein